MRFCRPKQSPSGGDWEIYDHGSDAVDQFWRNLFSRRDSVFQSLGGAIPPEDAFYVPPEFANEGRIPESYFICEDIWNAS